MKITDVLMAKIGVIEFEKMATASGLIIDIGDGIDYQYMGSGMMREPSGRLVDVPLRKVRAVRFGSVNLLKNEKPAPFVGVRAVTKKPFVIK